jgi:hypothetical protein
VDRLPDVLQLIIITGVASGVAALAAAVADRLKRS